MDGLPETLISIDLRSDHGTPRFSDIFGRKSALFIAMSLFMVGNLLAGFSKTIIQVIVFRGYASCFNKSFFLTRSQVWPVLEEVDWLACRK
jgi:hypothetical protein